jgi:O-succinylbenzoic acid--CoA ligase
MLVEAWLERAAAARPAVVALESPHGRMTYAELAGAARAGARALAARGVRPRGRVAIALPAGLDFACALHATLLAGAVAVPIDLRLAGPERERRMEGVCAVVDEPLDPAAPAAPAGGDPHGAGARDAADPGRGAGAVHELGAPAILMYTSGTSAAPKAVELTYGNVLWSAIGSAVAIGLDARERWLCAMPLAHVGGLSILLRSVIYATTAVIHERFDADRVLAALRGGSLTVVSLVAATLERLLDAGLKRGGPVPRELLARAARAGVPVSLTYGLTEACSQVATGPLGAPPADGARPLFCTRVRVGSGEAPEPDETGEILVRGPTVAPGALAADGWLHTGDLGYLDGAGSLHVVGRRSETIVSAGENIAPAEVEEVIESHPDVIEAAVIGRADTRWGEAVSAVVVPRPGSAVHAEALRSHCAARLARFKVPKRFELVAGPLPRTTSGKLLRRELR